jgi:hypothetical protein
MNSPKEKWFSQVVISLFLIFLITSCRNTSIIPEADSAESLESLLEDISIYATQTQEVKEKLVDQQSATPTPGGEEKIEDTTPVSPTPTKADTVLEISNTENLIPYTPGEIQFKPGGTIAYIKTAIEAGEKHTYTFRARAGQTTSLAVSSGDKGIYLELLGLDDGQILQSLSKESASITANLPSTQEYQITLFASQTDAIYFLTLEIPAVIDIIPGEKITLEGYVEVFDQFHPDVPTRVRYLIFGKQDQVLKVKLDSPQIDSLNLGLIGQTDGQAYMRYHVKGVQGELKLPLTQGYYLDVYSLGGESTGYTVDIELK